MKYRDTIGPSLESGKWLEQAFGTSEHGLVRIKTFDPPFDDTRVEEIRAFLADSESSDGILLHYCGFVTADPGARSLLSELRLRLDGASNTRQRRRVTPAALLEGVLARPQPPPVCVVLDSVAWGPVATLLENLSQPDRQVGWIFSDPTRRQREDHPGRPLTGLLATGVDQSSQGYITLGHLVDYASRAWGAPWIVRAGDAAAFQMRVAMTPYMARYLRGEIRDGEKKVLLVEDNEDNRTTYRTILEHFGYIVLEARNGEDAIRMVREDRPDLVLMDISIPLVDGWEATRMLKYDPDTREIPVIALTAHALATDRAKAQEVGCDGYLAKPCEPRRTVAMVERFVGPSRTW